MKIFERSVILLLWLFTIAAPSVITLFTSDTPIIVTSFNEEEQQEQYKINLDEEKIVVNNRYFMLFLFNKKERFTANAYLFLGYAIHTQRILLPPPESII